LTPFFGCGLVGIIGDFISTERYCRKKYHIPNDVQLKKLKRQPEISKEAAQLTNTSSK